MSAMKAIAPCLAEYTTVYMRLALGSTFLAVVTDRFGLWGPPGTSNVAWVSATAWKRTKAGKMKMWHFSGIKFAVGLAEETYKLLPLHEIRRKRAGRPNFSLNA